MTTIAKLQVVCFVAGYVMGYSYGQGLYAITALAAVAAGTTIGIIYTIIKKESKDAG